jgi:hypothetical protein
MAARRGLSVKERRRLRGRERIILKVENRPNREVIIQVQELWSNEGKKNRDQTKGFILLEICRKYRNFIRCCLTSDYFWRMRVEDLKRKRGGRE